MSIVLLVTISVMVYLKALDQRRQGRRLNPGIAGGLAAIAGALWQGLFQQLLIGSQWFAYAATFASPFEAVVLVVFLSFPLTMILPYLLLRYMARGKGADGVALPSSSYLSVYLPALLISVSYVFWTWR
jgi:hypothetical protein